MRDLIRAHGDCLGRGEIRTTIEDFQVVEQYDFEPEGTGEHLLLWIEKRGANTGWVSNQLAAHFNLRHFDVSYCGKKDRHAVTQQWFSCWLPNGVLPEPEEINIEGVEVKKVTRHVRKLRRGAHTGNRFTLRLRFLEVKDRKALEDRLAKVGAQGVPNYFGRQRFGREGQNYEKACELINNPDANSRRKLDRKQKDIYVSTIRAWLFNDELSLQVAEGSWDDGGDLWLQGLSPHRDIELPAPREEHRAGADFIEKLGIKAQTRAKRATPESLTWAWQGDDLELSFGLPVGAFATTLLEELLEIKDVS